MDGAEILDELTNAAGLPKAALQAVSEQRATIVPVFLREIDSFLALAPAEQGKRTPLFFIFHLLGEWREKTAYRPLARLLRCPQHEVDAILGDAITVTAHRVMAAVFDCDPQPLYEIILDADADQFVRSRMCEVLAMLVLRDELDRDSATRLHGATAASAILCLERLAERDCDARFERIEDPGQTRVRSPFYRSTVAWL
jgi:hypothetical protein